ncbi:MAG: hypothetical protein KKD83_03350 [Chloroflexi bacterium]|nr:hypothetical protein [Chloroflexota bacterium]
MEEIMSKLLWQPSAERVEKANMTRFINYVNQEYHLKMGSYDELYGWSIEKTPISGLLSGNSPKFKLPQNTTKW